VLQHAECSLHPLSAPEAEELIGPSSFADLCSRDLARVVLNEVAVLSDFDLDARRDRIDEHDRAKLASLRKESSRDDRPVFWIAEEVVRSFFNAHAGSHPSTPSWEEVVGPFGEARGTEKGFCFRVGRATVTGWFQEVLARASAKLWVLMLTDDRSRDGAALLDWLTRAGHHIETPHYMPGEPQEHLLSAALTLLATDPNIQDIEGELRALLGNPDLTIDLPTSRTCGSIHLFWKRLKQQSLTTEVDRSRLRLLELVTLVAKHDGLAKGVLPARILELVEIGAEKPYILHSLAWTLPSHRPDAIAWLLTRSSTAAFGLLLIKELTLQEPTMMDGWQHREKRTHARRVALMREALPLFVRAISLDVGEGVSSRRASTILEVLRGYAVTCTERVHLDGERDRLTLAHAEELFSIIFLNLAEAQCAGPTVSISLLAECAEEIVAQLDPTFPPTERQAGLKVAHEVLRFLRDNRPAFSNPQRCPVDSLLRDVAGKIVTWYVQCLELDRAPRKFGYFSHSLAIAELPWALTACTLEESAALGSWVLLPALGAKLVGAASTDTENTAEVVAGVSSRLRAHLEVLLRCYLECRKVLSASRATRDAVAKALEKEIGDLVLGRTNLVNGIVDLFDPALVISLDDTLARLVRLTARALTKFAPADGDRIIRQWIDRTPNPAILLDLEKELISPAHTQLVRQKLATPETIQRAEDGWLTSLFDNTLEAAAANHKELIKVLLLRGEEATADHPWRAQWEAAAFRASLLVAYHAGERGGVLGLELPPSAIGDGRAETEQRTALERSRVFYIALLDLATNPAAARTAFETQFADEPTSSALAVNLFAARLRVARTTVDSAAREQANVEALQWWDSVRKTLPDGASVEPNGSLNELLALEGAELDDEFDTRWFRLEQDVRDRLDLRRCGHEPRNADRRVSRRLSRLRHSSHSRFLTQPLRPTRE
jgi:hypothetical protein